MDINGRDDGKLDEKSVLGEILQDVAIYLRSCFPHRHYIIVLFGYAFKLKK